jgi:hypothetical protein
VTVFGSAHTEPGQWVYEEAKQMCSALLGAMNCDIITGGGAGLMQAANKGALATQGVQSIGIRVHLPFEQDVNPFVLSSSKPSSTRPSSPRCITSCSSPMPTSLPRVARNAARNNDDLAALADASTARHCAHFRRSHVEESVEWITAFSAESESRGNRGIPYVCRNRTLVTCVSE